MTHEELLKKIEDYHQNTDNNIIGVGYGFKTSNGVLTDEMSIIFTVKEKLSKDQLTEEQLLPSKIDLDNQILSTDVIQGSFDLFCDDSFYNWQISIPPNQNVFRPLKGGISSSNRTSMPTSTGTLGFFAIDNDTNSLVGISNNHVYINDAFICSERNPNSLVTNVKNNIISQPYEKLNDNFPIGVVKKYYPIRENPIGLYNYIDACAITINSGESYINSNTSFHQVGLSPSSYPFATTEEINNLLIPGKASYNPKLYSAGRTTGAKGEDNTKLLIYQFPVSASVSYYRQGVSTVIDYSDLIAFIATTGTTRPIQFVCNYPIWHGDSGSALIADISGVKKIIGLCFAGTINLGLACRIDRVATLLNLSEWNGEPVNFSDTSNILEYTVNGLSDSEYIDIEGKRYWQIGLKNI